MGKTYRVVLGSGFTQGEGLKHYTAEGWFFFENPEEFFKTVENLKGELLLFYITFEAGYKFLNLEGKHSKVPPFGLAVLRPSEPFGETSDFEIKPLGSSLSKEDYLKGFKKIKEYISSGDIYQVNYTVRFDFSFRGNPLALWKRFVEFQPVPYAVYFETPFFTTLGGSMELFLKREGKRLKSSPIKGTLPRKESPERFKLLEKELAENLMITDMVRNDLGRVAKVGTVKVRELFKVESYKTVHQLVSTVECETEKDFSEIIRATFPPASVTGAPKRRAVEIINGLEPHTRELYCGTVGIIKPNGDFVANVSIRTAVLLENRLFYYAGGGIVWDSEAQKEWREVLLKTEAFIRTTVRF